METLNSIGFVNLWGITPACNILLNENVDINNTSNDINILLSNTSDFRHLLKTISNFLEKEENKISSLLPKFNFCFYEANLVNQARLITLMTILNDSRMSIRDRVECLMEVYGNTLLSARTANCLDLVYKDLINFVTNEDKYEGALRSIVDLSGLTFKERDELAEIFANYSEKVKFDVEKYRDDRLRFMYKDRYDNRDNLADWDYNMNLRHFAPIVRPRHYLDFRKTGIAFELRFCKYAIPNRTLCSYIPGREKQSKDSCFVRGFWGDLVNSPFIGFGVELDSEEDFNHFYKHNNIGYVYDSQEITEFNLNRFIYRLEKNESYDYLAKEKERRSKAEEAKAKEESELKNRSEESSSNSELNSQMTKIHLEEESSSKQINSNTKDKFENSLPNLDESINSTFPETLEPLMGFRKLNVKISLLSGKLESHLKKKKFANYFDYFVLGLSSKNIFKEALSSGRNKHKLLIELNTYMTTFDDKHKTEYKEKLKALANEEGYILEDTSSKYMWKFLYKGTDEVKEQENNTNTTNTTNNTIINSV